MSKCMRDIVPTSIFFGIILLIVLQLLWATELPSLLVSILSVVICFIFVMIISLFAHKSGFLDGAIIGYLMNRHNCDIILSDMKEQCKKKQIEITEQLKDLDKEDQLWNISYSFGCMDTIGAIISAFNFLDEQYFQGSDSEKEDAWVKTSPQSCELVLFIS